MITHTLKSEKKITSILFFLITLLEKSCSALIEVELVTGSWNWMKHCCYCYQHELGAKLRSRANPELEPLEGHQGVA